MTRLTGSLKLAFMGFVVGTLGAVLLNQWTWLDMRLNIASLIPIAVIAGGAAGNIFYKRSQGLGYGWLLVPQTALLFALIILFWRQPSAILIVPAILLREGLLFNQFNIFMAKIMLAALVLGGNILWLKEFIKLGIKSRGK